MIKKNSSANIAGWTSKISSSLSERSSRRDQRRDQRRDLRSGLILNDVQSFLNSTQVCHIVRPTSIDEIAQTIRLANITNTAISVSGGRHAMGGQQFGTNNIHLDLTDFDRVLHLDVERGMATVESGIQWPDLIAELHRRQRGRDDSGEPLWSIREKQTGVDSVSIGGSLAANIHGRGLTSPPFIADIESFQILDSRGILLNCSRTENSELFSLAIGGYGLFGIVTQVTLRLVRRFKVRRRVDRIVVRDLLKHFNDRLDTGFVFGDCQYAIDLGGTAQDHEGIMPCYEPVNASTPVSENPVSLTPENWAELYRLTRTNKPRAFEIYAQHYKQTDGQVYWSDTHQLSGAFSGHRQAVDPTVGTEMITEVYLDHDRAMSFLHAVRAELVERKSDITYGTIRFIEQDTESFLPWARRRSVCVVVNLHLQRSRLGIQKSKQDFQAILDCVVKHGGSFYLTYHRWALPRHIVAAYPQIHDFFRLKRKYDPQERFQSDWYRHYTRQLGCFGSNRDQSK